MTHPPTPLRARLANRIRTAVLKRVTADLRSSRPTNRVRVLTPTRRPLAESAQANRTTPAGQANTGSPHINQPSADQAHTSRPHANQPPVAGGRTGRAQGGGDRLGGTRADRARAEFPDARCGRAGREPAPRTAATALSDSTRTEQVR